MMSFIADNTGIIGLVVFFIFFTVTAFKLCRRGAKQACDDYANIPFMEDSRDE